MVILKPDKYIKELRDSGYNELRESCNKLFRPKIWHLLELNTMVAVDDEEKNEKYIENGPCWISECSAVTIQGAYEIFADILKSFIIEDVADVNALDYVVVSKLIDSENELIKFVVVTLFDEYDTCKQVHEFVITTNEIADRSYESVKTASWENE